MRRAQGLGARAQGRGQAERSLTSPLARTRARASRRARREGLLADNFIDLATVQRVWGISGTSTAAELARAGLGIKDVIGKMTAADIKAVFGLTSPAEGKRLGLTCNDLRGFGWNLQMCDT